MEDVSKMEFRILQNRTMSTNSYRLLCLVWLLALAVFPVMAEEGAQAVFAIQLESAYKPDLSDYDRLKVYGKIYTYRPAGRSDGLVRVRLGHFRGREAARAVLEKVHAAGFPDAYLSRVRDVGAVTQAQADSPAAMAGGGDKSNAGLGQSSSPAPAAPAHPVPVTATSSPGRESVPPRARPAGSVSAAAAIDRPRPSRGVTAGVRKSEARRPPAPLDTLRVPASPVSTTVEDPFSDPFVE